MRISLRARLHAGLASCAAVLLLACASASALAAGPPAQSSVIGGRVGSIAEFPSLAFVGGENSPEGGFGFTCTGSVVAPRVVLTAGHCVEDIESISIFHAAGFGVATGDADLRALNSASFIPVSRALVYPHFSPSLLRDDAGLLILARPTAAPALPLAQPGDGSLIGAGDPVTVAGWGLTHANAEAVPNLLHAGDMSVQGPADCRRKTREYFPSYSAAEQLCTLAPPKLETSGCFGDSGGPLIAHRPDGTPVEVGIVSTGGPECTPKLPNIFTRVDRVSAWVGRWVAAVEAGAPRPAIKVLHPHPPRMRLAEARIFVAEAIAADFGHLFLQIGNSLSTRCSRVSRETFRCRAASWVQDGRVYSGVVTVFFAVRHDSVRWGSRYRIHSVDAGCRRSLARGDRVATCPVHTRIRLKSPLRTLPSDFRGGG